MASSVLCNSIVYSSSPLLSRTHFILHPSKEHPPDLSPQSIPSSLSSRTRSGYWNRGGKQRRPASPAATAAPSTEKAAGESPVRKLRVLVAGGGIGGLVFALAAKKKGHHVIVFEKDLSAIRGEGQYRGPIQLQSNALAALEAIDMDVADEVMTTGCITGDRINGLVDGVSGNWYIKFDTFTPAAERGLPVTRIISRISLQQILAQHVGDDVILNESNVVDFEDDGSKVTVTLENGQKFEGDLLVGADGIWSKVRTKLFGPTDAVYSGYTCYTGLADFVPADIETVGYRVFLGHKQYFVSSDVGAGKMQWYAFHKEPPGGVDGHSGKKERLMEIFGEWCDNVIDLISATDEDAILRRDIYDRTPAFTWGRGRVTLLGDSVHAMQPNLGQGGCMAIEDSHQLAVELDKAWKESVDAGKPLDVISSLKSYERKRFLRVAVIHGMARMAAMMASTYKAYIGDGLGPLSFLTKYRIPHPGRVGGRFFIDIAMPLMLSWVLGGNSSRLEGRPLCCRLSDKASDQLRKWFEDDDALQRAMNGEWILVPSGNETGLAQPIKLSRDESEDYIIGSVAHDDLKGVSITISLPQVSSLHARISYKDGTYFLTDLKSEHGSWISNNEGRRHRVPPNSPTRFRPSDVIEFGSDKKASFRVKVVRSRIDASGTGQGPGILQAA
ncbi:hypothetical protein SAY87_023983 [Trapa incisa]|uniref:Zeaxanthin epoxidase, chloroplastic n=1 Tax=Trapa incisa TaxID=236973 RepID=A0AAN7KYQ0_9MYRT|nr:hypothetical protein SAY87_023983 [Trapa incisa]